MARFPLGRLSFVTLLVSLVGCAGILGIPGDVERDTTANEPDSGPDGTLEPPHEGGGPDVDAAMADADSGNPPEPACNVAKAFEAPVPLDGVNTAEDEGAPHLSEDELTMNIDAVRASLTGTRFGIYVTTRATTGGAFGAIKAFPSVDDSINDPAGAINSSGDNVNPNLTADGKALVFERRLPGGDSDLYTATRSSTGVSFGTISSIANLNTSSFEAEVYLRTDASELWHVRYLGAASGDDIALATFVAGTGYVIQPATGVVQNLNSPAFDGYPIISKNGLSIYLGSQRPGGVGDTDIYVATRPSRTDPFSVPVIVENVNSPQRDVPGFISNDGCRLYLASKRDGGQGGSDLYVATKPK